MSTQDTVVIPSEELVCSNMPICIQDFKDTYLGEMGAPCRARDQKQVEKIALLEGIIKEQKENMEWLFIIPQGQVDFP